MTTRARTLSTHAALTHEHQSHEHHWEVESRHSTSDGVIIYQKCQECHERRIELSQGRFVLPEMVAELTRKA